MTHYISVRTDVRVRLDNDPLYKRKNLENVRARLDSDTLYKGKHFERAVDRKNKQIRVKKGEWDNLKEYKLSIREGPTHVCVCCGQLFLRGLCV